MSLFKLSGSLVPVFWELVWEVNVRFHPILLHQMISSNTASTITFFSVIVKYIYLQSLHQTVLPLKLCPLDPLLFSCFTAFCVSAVSPRKGHSWYIVKSPATSESCESLLSGACVIALVRQTHAISCWTCWGQRIWDRERKQSNLCGGSVFDSLEEDLS